MTPERHQLRRAAGWRMPPNTRIVDRRSIFGNPFTVEACGSSREAVRRFRHCLFAARQGWWSRLPVVLREQADAAVAQIEQISGEDYFRRIVASLPELRGRPVGCWCAQGTPCHGDILLAVANLDQS